MGLNRIFIVLIRILIILISAIELGLTASVFDYIVSHGMFHTLPDEKALIEKSRASLFYFTVILALMSQLFALSIRLPATILLTKRRKALFKWLDVMSAMLLTVMAIVCCTVSISNAATLSKFTIDAEPRAFEQAARWYYSRFCAAAIFWIIEAALSAVIFLSKIRRRCAVNLPPVRVGKTAM